MRRSIITTPRAIGPCRVCAAALALVACSDIDRNTELDPSGPPRILQVIAQERDTEERQDGTLHQVAVPRLAFGRHADLTEEDDDGKVDAAIPTERFRIVVDELLRGNFLEELQCKDETFSQVPLGTRAEDIARCSGADLSKCTAVCAGVGIHDDNGDGVADDSRLIAGTVSLTCAGTEVALDLGRSYYQPSGNQLIPAGQASLNGLGPAVVVRADGGMPTTADCTLTFGATVVDKDGLQPCTPAGGDPAADCDEGQISGISFRTEAFRFTETEPYDGEKDVHLKAQDEEGHELDEAHILVHFNNSLDAGFAAAAGFALTAGDQPVADIVASNDEHDPTAVLVQVPGGFKPATSYHLTFKGGATVKDRFGAALAAEDFGSTWATEAAPETP